MKRPHATMDQDSMHLTLAHLKAECPFIFQQPPDQLEAQEVVGMAQAILREVAREGPRLSDLVRLMQE